MQLTERSKSVFELLRTFIKVEFNNFLCVRKRILLRTFLSWLSLLNLIRGYLSIKRYNYFSWRN